MEHKKYLKLRELFKKEEVGLYENYEGGIYKVLDLAYNSDTKEVLVLYVSELEKKGIFAKPYHEFFAKSPNGQSRFQKI